MFVTSLDTAPLETALGLFLLPQVLFKLKTWEESRHVTYAEPAQLASCLCYRSKMSISFNYNGRYSSSVRKGHLTVQFPPPDCPLALTKTAVRIAAGMAK